MLNRLKHPGAPVAQKLLLTEMKEYINDLPSAEVRNNPSVKQKEESTRKEMMIKEIDEKGIKQQI